MTAHTCSRRGDIKPSTTDVTWVQDGWTRDCRRNMICIATQWLPIVCGHDKRATDPSCQHCPRAKL